MVTSLFVLEGYDCGVYAMCFAECVCAAKLDKERDQKAGAGGERTGHGSAEVESGLLHAGKLDVKDLMQGIGKEKATEWRSRTHSLILSLAKETHK